MQKEFQPTKSPGGAYRGWYRGHKPSLRHSGTASVVNLLQAASVTRSEFVPRGDEESGITTAFVVTRAGKFEFVEVCQWGYGSGRAHTRTDPGMAVFATPRKA